jgi:predicted GNAT family acetyltransferase
MNDFTVKHQVDEELFYIELSGTARAFIKYRILESLSDGGQVDFYSTFVPEEYRAQGLAAKLVQSAFAWADSENLTIKASCWYANKILQERNLADSNKAE